MKRFLMALLLLSTPALAQDLDDDEDELRTDRKEQRLDRADRRQNRAEKRERLKKEMELRRTLKISDEVGLNETQSLQISSVLRLGDERRMKIRVEMRKAVVDLDALAKGSGSAKDVDATIKRIQELRVALLKSEDETFELAAKGLTPIQKAKLALALGTHERQMKALMFQEAGKRRATQP